MSHFIQMELIAGADTSAARDMLSRLLVFLFQGYSNSLFYIQFFLVYININTYTNTKHMSHSVTWNQMLVLEHL